MRRRTRGVAAGILWGLFTATGAGHAAEIGPLPDPPRLGACGGGSGGFLLPDTAACLMIGGFVRAEGRWTLGTPTLALTSTATGAAHGAASLDGSLARIAGGTGARLTADLHLPTELGPVRVFVSLRGHNGIATDRAAR